MPVSRGAPPWSHRAVTVRQTETRAEEILPVPRPSLSICVHVCVWICLCVFMCVCACIHVFSCVCLYVCKKVTCVHVDMASGTLSTLISLASKSPAFAFRALGLKEYSSHPTWLPHLVLTQGLSVVLSLPIRLGWAVSPRICLSLPQFLALVLG